MILIAVGYSRVMFENNLLLDVQYPVSMTNGFTVWQGRNGFYNCGQTTPNKTTPATGWEGGIQFPELDDPVILDENPLVDPDNGDFRLKAHSLARGRGTGPVGMIWPGAPRFWASRARR